MVLTIYLQYLQCLIHSAITTEISQASTDVHTNGKKGGKRYIREGNGGKSRLKRYLKWSSGQRLEKLSLLKLYCQLWISQSPELNINDQLTFIERKTKVGL